MAKWGKVDYSELIDLREKMKRLEDIEIDKWCEDMAKEIASRLLRKAIKRTHVDTGDLRRAWKADNSNIQIAKEGNDYVVEIINSMSYASYVEYGHRTSNHKGWVKGRFMLTQSEIEMQSQAPKLLEKRLQEKLKELFNDK